MNPSNPLNQLLLEVSQSPLIDSGDYQATAEYVTRLGRKGLNVSRCSVWQLNNNFSEIRCLVLNKEDEIEYPNTSFTDCDYPSYFKALREKRFIVANNAHADPDTFEFRSYLAQEGINSILDAPIRKDGVIVGTFCCEHTGDLRNWTTQEQSFAATLADILGRALTASDRLSVQNDLSETNFRLSKLIEERTHHLSLAFEQISEQEKMASLGQLVAGIAHEINTPIGLGITTASHIQELTEHILNAYQQKTMTESKFKEYLASMEEGSEILLNNLKRAAELIKSFKQIAVDQTDDNFLEINLVETLNNIVKSLQPELKKKYQTDITLICETDIQLNSCPGSIAQILTNLLLNAGIHAFPEHQKDRQVFVEVTPMSEHVQIAVEDNGQGINQDIVDSVFDPFVTTRRQQGGSGLGLHIVYNLITQTLKGAIEVTTKANEYTRFTLKIPRNPTSVTGSV
jgi:signal transduction histidine kinase